MAVSKSSLSAGEIIRAVLTEDPEVAARAKKVTYKPTRTVWAERVSASGGRREEVGEHFPAYNVHYNIRDAHKVKENGRVKQLGGYLYTVTAIIPNADRGYKTLVCERVNE